MKITVYLVNDAKRQQLDLPDAALVGDTLQELDIPPDTVIVTRGGVPIPLDARLETGAELSVIRVVSGG